MARLISGSTGGGGGSGDVIGPASATDNAIARYDGTSGKVLQSSLVTVDDLGEVAAVSLSTNGQKALQAKPYGSGAGQTGVVSFHELSANGNEYVGFRAPDAVGTTVIWTLPPSDGSAGQVLRTSGAGVLSWVTAGLARFTEAESTAAPNATVYVDSLTAAASTANADLAIVPKGLGALLGQVPDGTATGGNKRGTGATDWQRLRSAATRVASGADSTIGGGYDNLADAIGATIGGGYTNAVSTARSYGAISGGQSNTIFTAGTHGFIGGGQANAVQAAHAVVVGGNTNTASAQGAFIGGGAQHIASGTYSVVVGGGLGTTGTRNNTAGSYSFIGSGTTNAINGNGNYAAIVAGLSNSVNWDRSIIGAGVSNTINGGARESGIVSGNSNVLSANAQVGFIGAGESNTVDSAYASIPGGFQAQTRYYGEVAHASGQFAAKGDAQSSSLVLRRLVTTGTTTELTFDGAAVSTTTNTITLTDQSAIMFTARIVARDSFTAGQFAWWQISGAIGRNAGATTTTLIGTNVTSTGNTGGNSAGWTCVITADATASNGRLQITVSNPASGGSVRFVAAVNLTRVA